MIRFATCSLLIAAVMIGFVSAQPTTLSIAGETKYKPHSLVRLKAEGVDPRAGMRGATTINHAAFTRSRACLHRPT
jgi:hypothetical protein